MSNENINPYTAPHSDLTTAPVADFAEVKMFSARGRLGRARYMAYLMGLLLLVRIGSGILMVLGIGALGSINTQAAQFLMPLLAIATYGFLLAGMFVLAVRRIHDFNRSGWLALLFLVPVVNLVFGIALWVIPGTAGANRYGLPTPPNGRGVAIAAALAPIALVAYIGILAAIAIPAYQGYVERARHSAQQPSN